MPKSTDLSPCRFKNYARSISGLESQSEFSSIARRNLGYRNKLAAVRRYFNSATKELNNAVQTFPSNLIAGMFGFHKEIMFDLGTEQRANLEQAPKINF